MLHVQLTLVEKRSIGFNLITLSGNKLLRGVGIIFLLRLKKRSVTFMNKLFKLHSF